MKNWRNIITDSLRRRDFPCGAESGSADMSAPGATGRRGMSLNVKPRAGRGNEESRDSSPGRASPAAPIEKLNPTGAEPAAPPAGPPYNRRRRYDFQRL